MACGVSMERYDPGEQEKLVLKIFRLKKIAQIPHPKKQLNKKLKCPTQKIYFCKYVVWGFDGKLWSRRTRLNSFQQFLTKGSK